LGRRRKCRKVERMPQVGFYKPQGVPLTRLRAVCLPVEAFEAIRLVDDLGLSQEEAAERMDVSRPTLNRILAEGRTLVARALARGWAIRIEGGQYVLHHEVEPDASPDPASPIRDNEVDDGVRCCPPVRPGCCPKRNRGRREPVTQGGRDE
jgi:predicted DNA-binding protein (UPF0251 family)